MYLHCDRPYPGPSTSVGRGASEIDIFEAEHAKDTPLGHVASMSAQFAPFSADYVYLNSTPDQWTVFSPNVTRPNSYKGSAVQQAVSGIVSLRDDIFQGSGQRFTTMGKCLQLPFFPRTKHLPWQVDGVPPPSGQTKAPRALASASGSSPSNP
ncbi:hypothetical protein C0992_011644 [Termitomyces sp. T32_za158]|nr:hypothetical protein C0992_011644 [Termitomyces sp. T32_za158]